MNLAVLIDLADHLRDHLVFPGEIIDEDDESLHPCNDSLRETQAWLREHGHDVTAWTDWLRGNGAHCDCQVVLNFEQLIQSIPFGQAG